MKKNIITDLLTILICAAIQTAFVVTMWTNEFIHGLSFIPKTAIVVPATLISFYIVAYIYEKGTRSIFDYD